MARKRSVYLHYRKICFQIFPIHIWLNLQMEGPVETEGETSSPEKNKDLTDQNKGILRFELSRDTGTNTSIFYGFLPQKTGKKKLYDK